MRREGETQFVTIQNQICYVPGFSFSLILTVNRRKLGKGREQKLGRSNEQLSIERWQKKL